MSSELGNNQFTEPEEIFLADVDVDYVPLHDMVRTFAGFYRHPTEEDYLKALVFISYLLHKYGDRIKYYIGPGVEIIHKSPEEFIDWLQEMWYKGQYKEIDFGVWFDMETEEENLSN